MSPAGPSLSRLENTELGGLEPRKQKSKVLLSSSSRRGSISRLTYSLRPRRPQRTKSA